MKDLLTKLNSSQYDAVTSNDKYIRVIAGAGSGKTRVLTTRLAYLIESCGVPAWTILAITFTNKAAREMRKRVEDSLECENCGSYISTYHSFCARFLREEISALNYPHNFIIIDEEDQEKIVKKLLEEADAKIVLKPSSVVNYISECKTYRINPEQALQSCANLYGEHNRAEIYAAYEEYLKNNGYLDFDDLLIKTVQILETNDYIYKKWSRRFNYILVDEFQDTNNIQYRLIQLLAGSDANVFVVGDPDQTIYTWRGANIDIIIDFAKDFPGAVDYVLDCNYRSTQSILNGANELIANNKKRIAKNLTTVNGSGAKIIYYQASTPEIEAKWVSERIKELLAKNQQLSYRDFAILYRSNYYSRAFESALYTSKIPYSIFGGVKFFERKEVKDAICYLRLLVRPEDNLALDRIINTPKRGVGDKTLAGIYTAAEAANITPYQFLANKYAEKVESSPLHTLMAAMEKYRHSLNETDKPNYGELLENLLEEVEYTPSLRESDEKERIENLKELSSYLFNFQIANPEVELAEIMQEIALYSSQDEMVDGNYVSLMTIHTAKGLEFPFVFVVGLSEGVFPNARSINSIRSIDGLDNSYEDNDRLEEERRLAYVAFTRAMKQLFISYSTGYNFASKGYGTASRFIREIQTQITPYRRFTSAPTTPFVHRPAQKVREHSVLQNSNEGYRPGEMVEHVAFGEGIIILVNETSLVIVFKDPKVGQKTISRNFTGIKKKG